MGRTQDGGGALLFVWSLEVLANLNTKNIHFAQLSTDQQASTVYCFDCFLWPLPAPHSPKPTHRTQGADFV